MAEEIDWQRYAKDFINLLADKDYFLLRRFVELFGDVDDSDMDLAAGEGPERAAKRLREAKLTTLASMVTSMLPEVKIPERSYKSGDSTSVVDHHPVMHAHYALNHWDAHAMTHALSPLQDQLMKEEPTWVIANNIQHTLLCEADTSAMYCMNAIKPCVELLNLKISGPLDQLELHVRAQYSSKQERGYGSRQDYTMVLHDNKTHKERPVVLIEFKRPDIIKLNKWQSQAAEGIVVTARELKKALRWFPQVLQYAGDLSVSHSAVADGRTFLPVIVGNLVDLSEADKTKKAKAIAELPTPNDAFVPKSAYTIETWDSEIQVQQAGNASSVSAGLSLAYLLYNGIKSREYGGPRVGQARIDRTAAGLYIPTFDLFEPVFTIVRKPHEG